MPLRSGDSFGRYTVLELIGSGGMGEVYRAQDDKLRRAVALKVLHIRRDEGSSGLTRVAADRMLREARNAAVIEHRSAVAVFDVGELAGIPYLVMELVQGKNLRAFIGDPSVPLERRLSWLVDVADALAIAHKKGVVHQDVKPENVMVRDHDGVVKVLDFGIARRLVESVEVSVADILTTSSNTPLHDADRIAGTPAYMAPEQLCGADVKPAADQFAWGVLAYELLAGAHPWDEDKGTVQLISQILSGEPVPLRERAPAVPEHVASVVARAMAKSPAARFSSMEELADGIVSPTPIGAAATASASEMEGRRDASGSARVLRPMWRPFATGLAAAAVLGAGILALAWRPWAGSRTPRDGGSPEGATIDAQPPGAPDFGSALSANAEAVAAYRSGVRATRDGDGEAARRDLDRALTLDAHFAAARLRRVLAAETPGDDERDSLNRAFALRATLSEHDRALLFAIEPWVRAGRADESARRLAAIAAKSPDPDTLFALCRAHLAAHEHAAGAAACARARELEPTFAAAWGFEGVAKLRGGDGEGGKAALDACVRAAPRATQCWAERLALASHDGACDAALVDARRLVELEPRYAPYRADLAEALLATGADRAAVDAALRDLHEQLTVPEVAVAIASEGARLAVIDGDFAGARRQLEGWEQAIASSVEERDHLSALVFRVALEQETGDAGAAARAATRFLAQRPALRPSPAGLDDAALDPKLFAEEARYRGGAVDAGAMEAERARWLSEASGEADAGGAARAPHARWALAFAMAAVTPEDAAAALAALPSYEPLLPQLVRSPALERAIGDTYRLAGRASEAIPWLARASSACRPMESAFERAWATASLAEARASSGDRAGACEAGARVLAAWGQAPSSKTAARARAAARACSEGGP